MKLFSGKELPSYHRISSQTGANVRRLLYLFHTSTAREKRIFLLLLLVAIISGITFISRMYRRVTVPVPAVGGVYIEGSIRPPQTINPVYAAVNDTDRDLTKLIFSQLIRYDGAGYIIPDLLERYEASADQKTYTAFLRKNAQWHDGIIVNADDVIFTITTIQDSRFKSPLRPNWQGVLVEKIDDYTVKFVLPAPYTPFVENLAIGIIPKHLWEGVMPEQMLLHELNLKPIGSGPYRFDDLEQEKDGVIRSFVLKRNGDYYRTGPYIRKIKVLFFKDEETLLHAWKRGDIDGFGPAPESARGDLGGGISTIHTLHMPRIFGLFMNQKALTAFADPEVRKAIDIAIDRKRIVEVVTKGGATPTRMPFPLPSFRNRQLASASSSEVTFFAEPERAKSLLHDAGWMDNDGDGTFEKTSGKSKNATTTKLRFIITTSDWPDLGAAAEEIRKQLRNIGIDAAIESLPIAELESKVIRPRKYEMLLFGQVYGYEPDPFAFWHSSQVKDPGLNVALYTNTGADKILDAIRKTTDSDEQTRQYQSLIASIKNDTPAIFLFTQQYLYFLPAAMKGVNLSYIALPSDRFNLIDQWYLKTRRVFK